METVQLRPKPRKAHDDVAEHADGENSASAAFEKSLGQQIKNQPDDDTEPADFFDVPGPISAPRGFRPGHAEDDAHGRE